METTKVRRTKVIITYNNKDITKNISKYIKNVTYTDYEKGQSDELSITLNDTDKFFQNDWRPLKGDKISAQIGYEDGELLDCGNFTIDESEFSIDDDGDIFVIRSLAASINEKIREKKSIPYRNKTLIEIAHEVAKRHGYRVAGSAGFIKIPYEAQFMESDMSFLNRLASKYGYIFKLTDDVISFIPDENLETQKVLFEIARKDIRSLSLRDCGTKTYNACSAKYLNPKTGKLVSYTARSTREDVKTETLHLTEKYATRAQAMAAAKAGLKNGSKAIEGNIKLRAGNIYAIAGINYQLAIDNLYDGKYHVTQSTHTVTPEDYATSLEVKSVSIWTYY